MKTVADSNGIPNFPVSIPTYLDQSGYDNYILLTNSFNLPAINEKLPHTKCVPNTYDLVKEITSLSPDIIIVYHHFGSPLLIIVLLLSKLLGIKTIAQSDINEYAIPKWRPALIKNIREFLRWVLIISQLHLFDRIVGASKYEFEVISKIKHISNKKYHIIPWGHDFEIKTDKKDDSILSVSKWWSNRKNLHTLLNVSANVIQERQCKIIIVGKFGSGRDIEYEMMYNKTMTGEEYEAKIMRLIEDLDLKEHVKFTGVVSSEELQELYRRAKVYYMPTKFETFGGVFVEAMASGTPVVAMKNSAVQYVVEDGVTGFLRDTEEGQKEAILKLFSDENLYKKMQENCLREAERYKWENVIKNWKVLINELTE